MSSDKLYQRTHEFTPYTTADGKAVQAEFDAIESALDHFPKMRDDGTGFAVSPVIPEPTEDDHPVNYGMYLTGVNNVKENRDEVERLTIEVRQHTQEVATNTQAVHNNTQTVLTAEQNVINKEIAVEESENMARKWASNPEDVLVKDNKYSAYHYALKAKNSAVAASQSEINAARSESASNTSANFAEQKANEANAYAEQARQAAFRENDWGSIANKPSFNSSVTSDSERDFATPKAVKIAYGKAVESSDAANAAQVRADNAINAANAAQVRADNAISAANAAQVRADNAISAANAAKTVADNAISVANTAQSTADSAMSVANTAQSRVNGVVTDIRLGAVVYGKTAVIRTKEFHYDIIVSKLWPEEKSGYVMTGIFSTSKRKTGFDYGEREITASSCLRPVQKNINGAWYTVASI
ncbi:hypothetical protein QV06_01145 [Gallibacterium genomosp. 3]|uniref:Phage tail protein n=1 Tax=Gallibacterium genomosp. 3 TaxID=505345 RepID=A0A1A7PX85_9PAST|nr:tail fiber protein [Gallibacterium genomosp. 3]OBX05765.1 hypothetical protein QV06_01145 [Gallibacterium genomosp. 3]